jgi:transmembrane 9 superfamily protein 2/4
VQLLVFLSDLPTFVGAGVPLMVNKILSSKTLSPIYYYLLPFCTPDGGPTINKENLGELLAGDRIQSSPYYLEMTKDMYCEQVCISNPRRVEE